MKTNTTYHTASVRLGAARSFFRFAVRCYRTTFNPSGINKMPMIARQRPMTPPALKYVLLLQLSVTRLSIGCCLSFRITLPFRPLCPSATTFSSANLYRVISILTNNFSFPWRRGDAIRPPSPNFVTLFPRGYFTKSLMQHGVIYSGAAGHLSPLRQRPMNVLKYLSIHRFAGQGRDK